MSTVKRAGFSPFIRGLDDALQGGVPEGSWVSVFGPPGSYKTLHGLAFCLNAVNSGERCIYVSTEMYYPQIKRQLESLGWKYNAYERQFTNRIIEDRDYGSYELVWIDLDSLYWWAKKLNAIVRDEYKQKSGSYERKGKIYWFDDQSLLTHIIMVALGSVGVLERNVSKISLREVEYARLKDRDMFKVNSDIHARVIIDSFSTYVTGVKYSVAGRMLTMMKIRLSTPNVTYAVVNHTPKSGEDELGASIGHVVDGRIKLWVEQGRDSARYYGWIAKMRETDHSRKIHTVVLDRSSDTVAIRWVVS